MQVQRISKPDVAIFLDVDNLLGSVSLSRLEGKYHFDPINYMIKDVFTGEDSHTYRCKHCFNCMGKQTHLFKGTAINSLEKLVSKIEKIANVRIVVSSTDQQKLAVLHLGSIFYHRGFSNIVFDIEDELLKSCRGITRKNYEMECEITGEKSSSDGYRDSCRAFIENNWVTRGSKIDKWSLDHSEYKGFLIFDEEYLSDSFGNQAVGNLSNIGDEFCKSLSIL
jgi:hypothetical protein